MAVAAEVVEWEGQEQKKREAGAEEKAGVRRLKSRRLLVVTAAYASQAAIAPQHYCRCQPITRQADADYAELQGTKPPPIASVQIANRREGRQSAWAVASWSLLSDAPHQLRRRGPWRLSFRACLPAFQRSGAAGLCLRPPGCSPLPAVYSQEIAAAQNPATRAPAPARAAAPDSSLARLPAQTSSACVLLRSRASGRRAERSFARRRPRKWVCQRPQTNLDQRPEEPEESCGARAGLAGDRQPGG